MTGLGVRSSSYGSLDKTGLYAVVLPIHTTTNRTKPSKMHKEREGFVHWICKFAGRKKVGMLLLFLISAVVFLRVLYAGKGNSFLSFVHLVSKLVLDNRSMLCTQCVVFWFRIVMLLRALVDFDLWLL